MSGVRKAVITAAGRGTRHFPATRTVQKELFPLVDRDGVTKPVLQLVAEEALDSGIERICIVCSPSSIGPIRAHFAPVSVELRQSLALKPWAVTQLDRLDRLADALEYVTQPTPEGYGDAVLCSREFVGDEPFLLLLGDHVYASHTEERCANVLLRTFEKVKATVFGVAPTLADSIHLFGVVRGERIASDPPLYRVDEIEEKPSSEIARSRLQTPGLPPETYLAFFGMHVLTPDVFNLLAQRKARDQREEGEIQLTGALADMVHHGECSAVEIPGERLDMGVPEGYLHTQWVLSGIQKTGASKTLS